MSNGGMVICTSKMTEASPTSQYALGSNDGEHQRLIRQAGWLTAHTERLFREAGIGPGQRVLDLGSGVGDVAMLVARLVGPSGEVVGVERDMHSIARARARVAEAGLRNVSFTESDVNQIANDKPFDAAVGRFILEFLPDPLAALDDGALYDCTIKRTKKRGKICVEALPPEEFLTERRAVTLDPAHCGFASHRSRRTVTVAGAGSSGG